MAGTSGAVSRKIGGTWWFEGRLDVGEGILIVENKPYHVYFQASRAEVEMITPYARQREELMQLPTRRR